jgi:hypothetical protein
MRERSKEEDKRGITCGLYILVAHSYAGGDTLDLCDPTSKFGVMDL